MYLCQGLIILSALSIAYSLNCYECDSSQSGLCNYGIASFMYKSVSCDKDSTVLDLWPKECVKFSAKNKEGNNYIARGCMPRTGGACAAVAKALNIFNSVDNIQDLQCDTCNTDNCNSGYRFAGFTLLTAILAIFAFLF